jgi:RimJ/RimL family protein N-acetyltransferase
VCGGRLRKRDRFYFLLGILNAPLNGLILGPEDLDHVLTIALENKNKGSQIPYTIVEKTTGAIMGTTRIGDIDMNNRNVEIGWTWLSPDYWRTGVNTECKYLLLHHCFEELKLIRVQFSVSGQNVRSQRAVERIGARKEGVFRKHRI